VAKLLSIRVRGPYLDTALGGVSVEFEQHIEVVDDFGNRVRVIGAVVGFERLDRDLGLVDILGVVDLVERRQRAPDGLISAARQEHWSACAVYADRRRLHFLRNVLAQVPKGSAEMVAAAISVQR
jgi:hypothetical protein